MLPREADLALLERSLEARQSLQLPPRPVLVAQVGVQPQGPISKPPSLG